MFAKVASLSPSANKSLPAVESCTALGIPVRRDPAHETPPLSRAGRKLADATMAAAKFKPTVDGKRLVRQYEVHGIIVTEWISAEQAADATKR
jgi:hypothetical protein